MLKIVTHYGLITDYIKNDTILRRDPDQVTTFVSTLLPSPTEKPVIFPLLYSNPVVHVYDYSIHKGLKHSNIKGTQRSVVGTFASPSARGTPPEGSKGSNHIWLSHWCPSTQYGNGKVHKLETLV
jgi:hypothetical protein